jgi:hypothetical protein
VSEWQPIETAPIWRGVKVMVGEGMEFIAILNPEVSIDADGRTCDQWQAVHEGEHPPCWSGGACWASNENGDVSLQPTKWREVNGGVA